MEKMKIFSESVSTSDFDFENLEKEVNAWLKKHSTSTITSRNMSTTSGIVPLTAGLAFVKCTICIFYKDTIL